VRFIPRRFDADCEDARSNISKGMDTRFTIRAATPDDIPAAQALIAQSARRLQSGDYTAREIELAIKHVYGVDSRLVADRTYFIVEETDASSARIVGCGGWSKRRTLYGGDNWRERRDDLLDPKADAARIRAFFIHPDYARQGLGTMLLAACEKAARDAGFTRFEAGATLTGVKLFSARGYTATHEMLVPLEGGAAIRVMHMVKP
jgi:N-acetylglutamate synthase-like GNAT family acetyltransferase